MTVLWANQALLETGWAENVRVEIGDSGLIQSVKEHSPIEGNQIGILLPAPVNVHSHAFQRAMAGLTEKQGPDASDSFWTWRQLMYRFLDRLTPEHIEAITALVQMEMLEAGYATNVEFHYIHHQANGKPYGNLAELAERVCAATQESGIGLTLLPVHYQYGGCDKRDLGPGQIRFGNDIEQFARLLEFSKKSVHDLGKDCNVGVAPHSLRAVAAEDLSNIAAMVNGGPVHMHLAEQVAEVEEVKASWGKRPVEWLLDNIDVDDKWCLIHCTQMENHETIGLAGTGAVAGLCPITESSLGDGIFDGANWLDAGGRIAVGSDSNIRISLSEELRTLEYSQRLRDRSRAALASPEKSTGRRLFDDICCGGAQASGRNTGVIREGAWADLMVLDHRCADFVGRKGDTILDTYIFAGDDNMVSDVWSAGRHMVRDGRHIKREEIVSAYASAMRELGEAL